MEGTERKGFRDSGDDRLQGLEETGPKDFDDFGSDRLQELGRERAGGLQWLKGGMDWTTAVTSAAIDSKD